DDAGRWPYCRSGSVGTAQADRRGRPAAALRPSRLAAALHLAVLRPLRSLQPLPDRLLGVAQPARLVADRARAVGRARQLPRVAARRPLLAVDAERGAAVPDLCPLDDVPRARARGAPQQPLRTARGAVADVDPPPVHH